MKNSLQFRAADRADIPAMAAIRLAVRENALSNPARITTQMYEDYLQRLGRGWVCEQDGAIIGFSYAAMADGSIWALFVSPDKEGLGAGAPLLKLASDWLFSQGHASVTLGTEADTRADRFYLAQGWTRGEMKDEDEVFYSLARPPSPSALTAAGS
jgi:GNAT superfamily N-acetyltransferase